MIYGLIGVSGVGKSYLVKQIMNSSDGKVAQLLAVTTRKKRTDEQDGIDKYFMSEEQFEQQKNKLILIRKMYGAKYGFRRSDIEKEQDWVVELYYKDYLCLKHKQYPVKGIYIWTPCKRIRNRILKKRYSEKMIYKKRVLSDLVNDLAHKIMRLFHMFDCEICNRYENYSQEQLLSIIQNK